MAVEVEQGFVIKKLNYGDNDLIVTILTLDHKFSFLALGVRKMESKNRIALQLGNLIEIEVFKARLINKISKLKRATIIKQFPLEVYDSAKIMIEILKIINKIPHPNQYFYTSLVTALPYFSLRYNHHIKTYFKFLNLRHHGLKPVMHRCYKCKTNKQITHFALEEGGFLCASHTNKKTNIETLKAYRDLGLGFLSYKEVASEINFQINKELDLYAKKTIF